MLTAHNGQAKGCPSPGPLDVFDSEGMPYSWSCQVHSHRLAPPPSGLCVGRPGGTELGEPLRRQEGQAAEGEAGVRHGRRRGVQRHQEEGGGHVSGEYDLVNAWASPGKGS